MRFSDNVCEWTKVIFALAARGQSTQINNILELDNDYWENILVEANGRRILCWILCHFNNIEGVLIMGKLVFSEEGTNINLLESIITIYIIVIIYPRSHCHELFILFLFITFIDPYWMATTNQEFVAFYPLYL